MRNQLMHHKIKNIRTKYDQKSNFSAIDKLCLQNKYSCNTI